MKKRFMLFCMILAFVFALAVPVSAGNSGEVTPSDSGWILASQAPAGAKIVAEKWTYNQRITTESQSSSLSGWTQEGSYWKQSGSGSFNYGDFSTASNPYNTLFYKNDNLYTKYSKSPYTSYENTTTKRVVSTSALSKYIYWHWTFWHSGGEGNYLIATTTNDINNGYNQWYAFESSVNASTTNSVYGTNKYPYVYYYTGIGHLSWHWFRVPLYQCTYTDYVKTYKFYKWEPKESSTAVTASANITNVQHWVKVAGTDTKFSDVPDNSWYKDYVYELVGEGILSGRPGNIFDPEGNITRAEFAKILACMSGENLTSYNGSSNFTDCTNHWAKQYINWAAAKGIVSGVGNNQFAPDQKITREALCTMVWRYAKYKGIYPAKTASGISFSDDGSISSWAKEAVYIMQKAGVINGKGNNCFDPKGNAKRNECSKVICCYRNCKNDTAAYNNLKIFRNKFAGYSSEYNFFLADLTHDGVDDLVVTYYKSIDMMNIDVYTNGNGSVKKIFNAMVGNAHASMGGYYLMEKPEGAYLVYHYDSVYGGIVYNTLQVFSLKSDGTQVFICDKEAVYDYAGPNPSSPTKYYYEVLNLAKSYESQSTLLADMEIWTENGDTPPHTKAPFSQVFGNLGK